MVKAAALIGIGVYILQASIGAGIGVYTVFVTNGGLDEVVEAWSWLF